MNVPAHIALAASLALGGPDGDAADDRRRLDLHEAQLEFIADESYIVCVLAGRQGGKSFVMAGKGCKRLIERPRSYVLILGLTSDGCRDSVWPEIKLWAEDLGIDEYVHEHEMRVGPLPNGSYLKCKGTDDRRAIENRRGAKPDLVMIDEMGSQDPAWIEYFVISVVGPSMIKRRGQIVLAGTPGLVLAGYWFDLTNDDRDPDGPPVYTWTAWDNPGLGTPEDVDVFVQTWLDAAKLDRDSTAYLREWKGKWVKDLEALVYPLEAAEGGRNWCARLPTHNRHGYQLAADKWRLVLWIDVGMVDKTALGVSAAHPDVLDEFVVWSEKHTGMLPRECAARVRQIHANVDGIVPRELAPCLATARRVMDTGGMGKVHAEEFSRVFGLYVTPAKKTEKESAIELNRGRIKAGTIKVQEGERNDAFRSECAVIGWDPRALAKGKRLPMDGVEDDAFHGMTYGHRELRVYVNEEPAPGHDHGTAEWHAAQVDRMRQQRIEQVERRVSGRHYEVMP